MESATRKKLDFIGTSRADLQAFPKAVRYGIGMAFDAAQDGMKAANAKPLKGFRGTGVLEVIEDHDGDTYRAVYTVRLRHAVYVVHCWQKKSTHGIATAKRDLDLVAQRLREAEAKDREKGAAL